MKKIEYTGGSRLHYEDLVDTFECETIFSETETGYQGDAFYLLRKGDEYGVLTYGWGSCSLCDALESIFDDHYEEYPYDSKYTSYSDKVKELTELRDDMYESITWRSRDEMKEYIDNKDFSLEYYAHSYKGREFVSKLKELHLG